MTQRRRDKISRLSIKENNLLRFLAGLFLITLLTQIASNFEDLHLKLFLKTIGYGLFFYVGTPFTLYWLAYLSSVSITRLKFVITVFLVGVFSYIFWDSYFFYKETLGQILFSASPL